MRELTENYENIVMAEGTSNEDHTPPDELMSDNEFILYEITDEPVDSPVQEPINNDELLLFLCIYGGFGLYFSV